jgi:hypothetical protein
MGEIEQIDPKKEGGMGRGQKEEGIKSQEADERRAATTGTHASDLLGSRRTVQRKLGYGNRTLSAFDIFFLVACASMLLFVDA